MNNFLDFINLTIKAIKYSRNFSYFILDYYGHINKNYILNLRNETKIFIRPKGKNVVGDIHIVEEVMLNHQYQIEKDIKGDVIDIGAHIGTSALYFARLAKGKIYAYEPFSANFKQLKTNLYLNSSILKGKIKAFPLGIWGHEGKLTLYLNKVNTGAHTVLGDNNQSHIYINCCTLEQIFWINKLDRVSLLKLDCEGAEYEILFKSPGYILKKIDEIVMELHKTPSTENLYKPEEMISFLKSNGFSVKILRKIYYSKEGWFWIVKAKNKSKLS